MAFDVAQNVFVRKAEGGKDGKSINLEPRYEDPLIIRKTLDRDIYL